MRFFLLSLLLAGCGDDDGTMMAPPGGTPLRWDCPRQWLAHEKGGCGPAILLCEPGKQGIADGCAGAAEFLATPRDVLDEGEVGSTFWRDPAGGIAGGWPREAGMGGPPDRYVGGALVTDYEPLAAAIGTCPPGWAPAEHACDPMLRTDCPAGTAPLPGGICTLTGEADCPAATYADLGAGVATLHVISTGDDTTADGSEALPYRTLGAALAAAAAAAEPMVGIAIGPGSYDGVIAPARAITIAGLCAARTTITASTGDAVIDLGPHAITISGVTLQPGTGIEGIRARAGADGVVRGVVIDHASGNAIHAGAAGELELIDVLVQSPVEASDGTAGRGIYAHDGAHVVGTRVAVLDARSVAVWADLALTDVGLTDSLIRGTRERISDGLFGRGAEGSNGGALRLERTVVEDSRNVGVIGGFGGTRVTLTDVIVRGTRSDREAVNGGGIEVVDGAMLTATRLLIEDTVAHGLLAGSARAELTEVVVRDIASAGPALATGYGLTAQGAGNIVARGARIERATASAVFVSGSISRAELDDLVVASVQPSDGGPDAEGLVADAGGTVVSHRFRIEDAGSFGALATGSMSALVLEDGVIHATRPRPSGSLGHGVQAQAGAVAELRRVLVAASTNAGVVSLDPMTRVTFEDGWIAGVAARSGGAHGVGFAVSRGGSGTLRRSRIVGAIGTGAASWLAGSTLVLRDVEVASTQPAMDGTAGVAVVVLDHATADVRRSVLRDSTEAGLLAFLPSTMVTLKDVIVTGVVPSSRGYGLGVVAIGGAAVDAERVAVLDAAGAGIAAVSYDGTGGMPVHIEGSNVSARDLYVGGTGSSSVMIDAAGRPVGMTASYGVSVASGSSFLAEQLVVDDGGFGFHAAGDLTLRLAVAVDQSGAGGIITDTGDAMLEDFVIVDGSGNPIRDRSDLPAPTSVPAPIPLCLDPATCG